MVVVDCRLCSYDMFLKKQQFTHLPEGGGGDWLEAVEVSLLPPAVTSGQREREREERERKEREREDILGSLRDGYNYRNEDKAVR